MNCKYNNSMYTTNPPQTIVETIYTEEEYFEETIRDHNLEESYEKWHIQSMLFLEDAELNELIKHEPSESV